MPKLKVSKPPSVELFDNDNLETLAGFDLSKIIVLVLLVLVLLLGYFMFKLYQKMTKSSEEVVLLKEVIGKQAEMLSNLPKMQFMQPPAPPREPEKEPVKTVTEEVSKDNTLETVIEDITEEEKSNLDDIDDAEN